MQVCITGASGVIGRRLVAHLTDGGHDVVGLVRDDHGAEAVREGGGIPVRGDILDPASFADALADCSPDVAVHAATAIPTDPNPTDADWARNDRVRRDGAAALVQHLGTVVERVVFPSVVWLARRSDGEPFDETADRNPDRATRSAADVERFLERTGPRHGFEVTVLRLGFLYGPDATHTRSWAERLASRSLPTVGAGPLGRRPATWSFLHADDAGTALATAIEAGVDGCYHVVDDAPVTTRRFFERFAALLDAPRPRRLPAWLARRFLDDVTATMLTASFPTTNERFVRETGWEPSHPTSEAGLRAVVSTWEQEGWAP